MLDIGVVKLANTYKDAEVLAKEILLDSPLIIGLDTETTIGRLHNEDYISLLQIYYPGKCYLFQLYRIHTSSGGLPNDIEKLLKKYDIVKVGVDLTADVRKFKKLQLEINSWLDIQAIERTFQAIELGQTDNQKLNLSLIDLGHKYIPGFPGKDKKYRSSDWDINLDQQQIYYASYDAYYSYQIYIEMMKSRNPVVSQITNTTTVPETIQVQNDQRKELDESEIAHFLSWLRDIINTSIYGRTYKSIVNQAFNSYGPWKKRFFGKNLTELIVKCLDDFVKDNALHYDKLADKFYPKKDIETNILDYDLSLSLIPKTKFHIAPNRPPVFNNNTDINLIDLSDQPPSTLSQVLSQVPSRFPLSTLTFPPSSVSLSSSLKLTEEDIIDTTNVLTGILGVGFLPINFGSAVNKICNSYGRLSKLNISDRKERATKILKLLQDLGKIRIETNTVIFVHE